MGPYQAGTAMLYLVIKDLYLQPSETQPQPEAVAPPSRAVPRGFPGYGSHAYSRPQAIHRR